MAGDWVHDTQHYTVVKFAFFFAGVVSKMIFRTIQLLVPCFQMFQEFQGVI